MTAKTYAYAKNAAAAAVKTLKAEGVADPKRGEDFTIATVHEQVGVDNENSVELFIWLRTPAPAPKKAKAPDPRVTVDGVTYPNLTRANEARRLAAERKEDKRDAKVAKTRLAEIAKDPGQLVQGDELAIGTRIQREAAAAAAGELPPPIICPPSWPGAFVKRAQVLMELAAAGDLKGLKAIAAEDYDSRVKKLARYQRLAIAALESRPAKAA